MLSLLFWQFANHTTKTSEAKRFYPMFGLIGNTGLILSGFSIEYFAKTTYMVDGLVMLVAFSVVMIMSLYYYLNAKVLTDPRYAPVHTVAGSKKEKPALSFVDGIKVILSSKYIGLIVILLLSYGVSINLVEGPWKAKVRELYPTQQEYLHFMGGLQKYMGVLTMIVMFVGAHIMKRISWRTGAMFTPLVILITGAGFFALVVFDKYMNEVLGALLNISTLAPLYIAVQLGLWQNVTSKGVKYAFFDATKEMAYIPVDKELQTKGKAAADVVAARFAKSLGSLVISTLFIFFPAATFTTITPYLMVVFLVIIGIWMVGITVLSREYERHIAEHNKHVH
jgi:AAA family ATP:ADP antiporter